MADLDAFSCANGWVYVRWEIPSATATQYTLFRKKGKAAETTILPATPVAAQTTGLAMVAPGTAGASAAARSALTRFFPTAFTPKGQYRFRLLWRDTAATVAEVSTSWSNTNANAQQAEIDIDPSLTGVLVTWRPQYPAAAATKPLFLEMRNSEAADSGWQVLSAFDEADAANVTLPYKQWGYFLDQAAGVKEGTKLTYRLQVTDPAAPGGVINKPAFALTHEWTNPEKLVFFLDPSALPEMFVVKDGANVVPYFDHFAPVSLPQVTSVCLATRYDHPKAGKKPKSFYYLTHTNDKLQADRFIPSAEGADGLVATVAKTFGGHHVTHKIKTLTTIIVPMDGAVGYAWGSVDNDESPIMGWGTDIGNRRSLMYVGPYPGAAGDEPTLKLDVNGTFSHEYQHLNYHHGHLEQGRTAAMRDEDRSLDEGCGFWAEDVVDSFNLLFWDGAMNAQQAWENLFLIYDWPSGSTYQLYARGAAWVMYNVNRLGKRTAMKGHKPSKIPRGHPVAKFAPFLREFHLTMGMNAHMPENADLPIAGYVAANGHKDELQVSLKRKEGKDFIVRTPLLRDWAIKPHAFGSGATPGAQLARVLRSVPELQGRGVPAHYDQNVTITHSSAYFAAFEPSPDGVQGPLNVELNYTALNLGKLSKVVAVARRIGDGTGKAKWEYYEVPTAVDTILTVPDFGTRIDHVMVVMTTEQDVPIGTAPAPTDTVDWTYYVSPTPDAWLVGVEHQDAYRGGDNVVLTADPAAAPPAYVGPGQVRTWVQFNQGMQDGAVFHAHRKKKEVALPIDAFARAARDADLWRGSFVQISAAKKHEGEPVTIEIGRGHRKKSVMKGGVRSFAGAWLDGRDDRLPSGDPLPDKRWRAVMDTTPPTLKSVKYVNGDGTSGAMANGLKLVGVVSLEVAAEDKTSGVLAIEIIGRARNTPDVYSVGRKVFAPGAADGEYAHSVTETFFWNSGAAANGPVDFELVVSDRVGNRLIKKYDAAVIHNPKPGAAAVAGALVPPPGKAPTLTLKKSESDGGTGAWAALAAAAAARGKLRFRVEGTADSALAQLVVTAKTVTSGGAAREIWSEWIAAGGAAAKDWETDGRVLPDGDVTIGFVLKDEGGTASPEVTFAFKCANDPPRIVPLEPRPTTRGAIDVVVRADDRCSPAIDPGACEAHWAVGGVDKVTRPLGNFPDGSYLRRAAMSAVHAPAGGFDEGAGELKLKAGAVDLAPLRLLVLHDLGDYHPLPPRAVRLTTASTAAGPRFLGEVTCAAEHAVLFEGATPPKVSVQIKGGAPIAPSDVTLTFTADAGAGSVTMGAVQSGGADTFTATASAADGKQGKGVLKVAVKDSLGNESALELPLWVVKEPLASKALFHVRYGRALLTDKLLWDTKTERLAGDGAPTQYMPGQIHAVVKLGELGLHAAEAKLFWKPSAGAEVDMATLGRSVRFAEAWDGDLDFTAKGVADGAGKFILKLKDRSGNEAKTEIDGFAVDATAPTATISTASTPASAVSITLSPAPADTGSGLDRAVVLIQLTELDAAGTNTDWSHVKEFTGGAITLPWTVFKSTKYNVTVLATDKVGNQPTAPIVKVINFT